MQTFRYEAADAQGRIETGTLEADSQRADVRDAGGLEHPAPAAIVLAKSQVFGRVIGRWQDIGAALPTRCRRKQPIRFFAHGLGNAADLAVGPHHAPVLEVQPAPLERADFGAPCGKLELQPDSQRDDVVLQPFRLQLLQMAEDPHHFLVHDEPGFLARRVHRDVAARIRAVRAVAPHFGQVEHLAQHAEGLVRLGRLVGQLLHQSSNVGPLHVMHLLAAQQRDDVAVDDALIAVLRAGLVALLGVVLHELLAQLGHRGRLARLGLGAAGVAAPANLGQPVLCLDSCLFDGQLPVQPQRGLAGLAGVRAVLEHEHPAARRGNLAQEARHHGIPQFNILGLGLGRLHGGLGELDLCHDDSLERPGFQEPDRSGARENRVKFQKAPAYDGRA